MPVLLFLILLPLVEIALFIAVGGQIGLWPTLALVILGGLLGVLVLQGQRDRAVAMMQGGLRGVSTGRFLAQGAFRTIAGMLLILPGFLSDALGLILLIPAVQRAILRMIAARAQVTTAHVYRRGDIIEGEFEVRDPGARPAPHGHIDGPRRH